jgi:hypothetical protein
MLGGRQHATGTPSAGEPLARRQAIEPGICADQPGGRRRWRQAAVLDDDIDETGASPGYGALLIVRAARRPDRPRAGGEGAVQRAAHRPSVRLHPDPPTPRPLLLAIAPVAIAGAASPLHGAPPGIALGSAVLWRVEIAVAVTVVVSPAVRALALAGHGKVIGVHDANDDDR